MNKKSLLSKIRNNYFEKNVNVMQYLHQICGNTDNDIEDIMISYDFQAGSYIKEYVGNEKAKDEYLSKAVSIIDGLEGKKESFLECGTGEATVLAPLIKNLKTDFKFIAGIDISWSRIKYASRLIDDLKIGGGQPCCWRYV